MTPGFLHSYRTFSEFVAGWPASTGRYESRRSSSATRSSARVAGLIS